MHNRFSQRWLETLCELIPEAHSAVFMVPDEAQNQAHLLASWPQDLQQHQDFFAVVKYALKKNGEVCLPKAHKADGAALDYFARPVYLDSRLAGVLALKIRHLPAAKHPAVFRALKLAIRWLRLAGAELMQAWHLPPSYQQVAAFHLDPEAADEEYRPAVWVVSLAHRLCQNSQPEQKRQLIDNCIEAIPEFSRLPQNIDEIIVDEIDTHTDAVLDLLWPCGAQGLGSGQGVRLDA